MQSWRILLPAICIGLLLNDNGLAQRKLAPGVLKVIQADINPRDTHSLPMPLPGVDAADYLPNFPAKAETLLGQTQQVVFFRDVWQYEFAFLELRQLKIETRDADGNVIPRNIWYLVHRFRNTSQAVSHKEVQDAFGHKDQELDTNPTQLDPTTMHGRIFARFYLEGWVQDLNTGEYTQVSYQNKIVPGIVQIVQEHEDPDQPLLDTIEIAKHTLKPVLPDSDGGGVWGAAVWFDVDPRIDFVSVKVTGLTNAYRLVNLPDGKHDFQFKTLQLNFWRPGDTVEQAQDVVEYGIPLVDAPVSQIEIAERYALPGPVIRCEVINKDTQRRMLVFEADAELRPRKLDSEIARQLNGGQLPEKIQRAFTDAGITLGADVALKTEIDGSLWTVTDTSPEGVSRKYILRLHPEFWDTTLDGGITFLKSLDYLWIYR